MTSTVEHRWRELSPRAVLLDGFHALKHALRFGAEVPLAVTTDLVATRQLAKRLAPDLLEALAAALTEVPGPVLAALVPRPHPTGVAALAIQDRRPVPPAGQRRGPLVMLDNPRHLGNTGAVVRLAAGAGAAGVLTTGTVDPWHPAVVRAAAGLHFALPVEHREVTALPDGPLYALDPEGTDLRQLRIEDDALLAFGSERHGLSTAIRERATELVALPMRPGVSSYNLATSVSMVLYHWLATSPSAPHAGSGFD